MPQLNFVQVLPHTPTDQVGLNNGTISFTPLEVGDSISLNTLAFIVSNNSSVNMTRSYSVGLYSLNGNTLSLANSGSVTRSTNDGRSANEFVNVTTFSATQNITPGTWWIGILASTAGTAALSIWGQVLPEMANAFPGAFIGGAMTESTNALPASYATSDLDITGTDAMFVPYILINAV